MSHSWTVDLAAPETTIADKPSASTTSTSATFTFSSGETGATFECALYTAAFAACTSPREYSGLAIGGHEFRVRAKDSAGNLDASPASRSWTIEAPGTESGVTWSTQSMTTGEAATALSPSSSTYVQWSVASQVQSMYASGNHGFLIRDQVENGNRIEQASHSREKAADNPPQLVITFA